MEKGEKVTRLDQVVAKPARLLELVAYQEGAVVSRAIIHKKTGSLTLFAFDELQHLSEHTSPYDATLLLLEGELEVVVSGEPFRLQAGEIAILPANQPHAVNALKKSKMLLTMLRS